jgi:serine/threonine protein kinase/tetratricopeptide (TPR) repeat protein
MGSVWRGVHRESGLPAAVKVLHKAALRDGRGLQGFRNEVRAVAGLDHPGVVWVFDVGTVPPVAAQGSNGLLEEGSPYLAMEYASGGTLSEFVPKAWPEVKALLLELLSILGHAHARGVVHRDLKPGNVILGTSQDVRPGWKLTDFGIAAALEETVERSIARGLVGTLAYMSPEQIRGDWREFGPWTDLYALGCLVYRVVGNQRPFRETRGPALITAHLTQNPQTLEPRLPVPALFAQWVEMLMAKAPRERFQSAAEAARVLQSLGPALPALPALFPDTAPTAPPQSDEPTEIGRHRRVRDPLRVVPTNWRERDAPWPPPRLVGAGLGLLGLRSIPIVGRHHERDTMWSVLSGVLTTSSARVVVVRGAVGVGKSRVARWLGETAHALGGLPFLVGEARADEAPQEALARPFRRWFRTVRLPMEERTARLATALGGKPEDELVRLATTMLGQDGETGPSLEGDARHAVARRLLDAISGPARPAVLLLDDAHHSHDTIRFAKHVLEAQAVRPFPALVVLTVSEEAAAAEASLYHELATLLAMRGVDSITLGALPPGDHASFVQNMLPFEPTLAALLVERTAGNPLHASELVKDWATHGRLVRGEGGFELSGPLPAVPPMAEVWANHVDHVVAGLDSGARLLLERAAALGSPVDEDEWQRVCDDPKGTFAAAGRVRFVPENAILRNELRVRLIAAHLAEENELGWAFVHEMLRQSLLQQADAAGRLGSHHRSCARILLHRPDARLHAARIGRHLLLGGRPAQAVEHLSAGFRRRRRQAGDLAALPLLSEVEQALVAAGLPESALPWLELQVRRAEVLVRLERPEDAIRWAQRGAASARKAPDKVWEARALLAQGQASLLERHPRAADDLLASAEQLLSDTSDQRWLGEVHAARAKCARLLGDANEARGHSFLAARYLASAGERSGVGAAWNVLAENAFHEGAFDDAERHFERARVSFARTGNSVREADAWTWLGLVARWKGDLERSRALLTRAVERYTLAGSPRVTHGVLGLARLHLARREWEEARTVAGTAVTGRETARQGPLEADIHAVLAAAAAGLRDWTAFDVHVEQIHRTRQLADQGSTAGRSELGWCLEIARARAMAAGEERRAERTRPPA